MTQAQGWILIGLVTLVIGILLGCNSALADIRHRVDMLLKDAWDKRRGQ
jgi:hypothetical protein